VPLKGRLTLCSSPIRCSSRIPRQLRPAGSPTGRPLSEADAEMGNLASDGSWRWATPDEPRFRGRAGTIIVRHPNAYPRRSKLGQDPEQGLASIEALYAAYRALGRATDRSSGPLPLGR